MIILLVLHIYTLQQSKLFPILYFSFHFICMNRRFFIILHPNRNIYSKL